MRLGFDRAESFHPVTQLPRNRGFGKPITTGYWRCFMGCSLSELIKST